MKVVVAIEVEVDPEGYAQRFPYGRTNAEIRADVKATVREAVTRSFDRYSFQKYGAQKADGFIEVRTLPVFRAKVR